ncbi:MAG: hypothetical protein JKY24_08835 [Pseudomonadales bacterium]|nr:hypothetical protein [Pseudomonadales bacterium]
MAHELGHTFALFDRFTSIWGCHDNPSQRNIMCQGGSQGLGKVFDEDQCESMYYQFPSWRNANR